LKIPEKGICALALKKFYFSLTLKNRNAGNLFVYWKLQQRNTKQTKPASGW